MSLYFHPGAAIRAREARPDPTSWRTLAACRDRDLSLWFAPEASIETRIALRVCRGCPSRSACLAAALDEETGADWSVHGVRGGKVASERRLLRTS